MGQTVFRGKSSRLPSRSLGARILSKASRTSSDFCVARRARQAKTRSFDLVCAPRKVTPVDGTQIQQSAEGRRHAEREHRSAQSGAAASARGPLAEPWNLTVHDTCVRTGDRGKLMLFATASTHWLTRSLSKLELPSCTEATLPLASTNQPTVTEPGPRRVSRSASV